MHLGFIHHNQCRATAVTMHIATSTETTEIAPTTPGLKRLELLGALLWLGCVDFIVTVSVGGPRLKPVARLAGTSALGRTSKAGMVVIVKAWAAGFTGGKPCKINTKRQGTC